MKAAAVFVILSLFAVVSRAQLGLRESGTGNIIEVQSDQVDELRSADDIRRHYESIHGPDGDGISYDEDGKPFISCQVFKNASCEGKGGADCLKNLEARKCTLDQPHHRLACMSVWYRDAATEDLLPNWMGCWSQDEDQLEECGDKECVGDPDRGSNLFCCCRTHNCNTRFVPASPPPTTVQTTPAAIPAYRANPFRTILFALLPLCGVALLVCCAYYAYRTYANRRRYAKTVAGHFHHRNDADRLVAVMSGDKMHANNNNNMSQQAPLRNIELLQVTARGRFGQVYKARMDGRTDVAVKVFPGIDTDSWVQEQYIYRLEALRAGHPNILQFIGAEHRGTGAPSESTCWLITAYQHNGSVHDYLKVHTFTVSELMAAVSSMLNGLAFLHEEYIGRDGKLQKPTIVHRDMKSKNVLLKADLTAAIADFGLALQCENGRTPKDTHAQVGTHRYMSPEVLEGATEFSAFAFRQIDVYAASLIVWECLSRTKAGKDDVVPDYKLPYEAEVGTCPSLGDMRDVVINQKKRPQLRQAIHDHPYLSTVAHTMEEMWDMEPEGRITAGCAYERLTNVMAQGDGDDDDDDDGDDDDNVDDPTHPPADGRPSYPEFDPENHPLLTQQQQHHHHHHHPPQQHQQHQQQQQQFSPSTGRLRNDDPHWNNASVSSPAVV